MNAGRGIKQNAIPEREWQQDAQERNSLNEKIRTGGKLGKEFLLRRVGYTDSYAMPRLIRMDSAIVD